MVEDALSFWTEIQRYEDTLATDPKSLCFAPLSELYRKLGLFDDAISVAQKGCAAHPDYPLGFLALGNACHAKGETAQAREALEKAVALKPDHIQALKLLSQIYVELGEIEPARQVLARLLRQDPDDLESGMLMKSIASAVPPAAAAPEEEPLDDLEIIEELEEVIEEPEVEAASPRAAAPLSSPGGAPSAHGMPDEDLWAIEDLEEEPAAQEAASLPPRAGAPDPLTTATLAELYVSQGFLEKAMNIYRELLATHTGNQQYRLRLDELAELQELQLAPAELAPSEPAAAPQPLEEPAAPVPFTEPSGLAEVAVPVSFTPSETVENKVVSQAPAFSEANVAAAFPSIESPAEQEAASLEPLQLPHASPQGDVESALERWLENIRRRKDGV